ncbi:Hypothetical predicted protein [Olea europaea subsp. europaea]|uniref:Uncharacterized protein n=1 Tax=Olea europaea subsp. europaea TaxID=158383 RepID=A0A8S0V893_OLEEU|nr:Hypothetical predicted protein [Olea europaea subsp. europaea]
MISSRPPQQATTLGGRRSGSHVWQLLEQTPNPRAAPKDIFPGNAETFSAPHQQEKAQEAEPLGVGDVSRSAVTLAHSTSSVVSVIRGDLPASN